MKRAHYFLLLIILAFGEFLIAIYFAQEDVASRFRFLNQYVTVRPEAPFYAFDSVLQILLPLLCLVLVALLNWKEKFFGTSSRPELEPFRKFLIFCAVFVVLAAWMKCGNGMETRRRLIIVRSDMRTMAIAIESYHLDHQKVPGWATGAEGMNNHLRPTAPDYQIPTFRGLDAASRRPLPVILTTPVAYITHYPNDLFAVGRNRGATFGYYANDRQFILFSPGPDLHYDIQITDFPSTATLALKAYDPSNGGLSGGDVFRYSSVDD